MSDIKSIKQKLTGFIKYYYINKLIYGLILFLIITISYGLIIIALEHYLWLSSITRQVLFYILLVIALILLYKFILTPIFFIFKIRKPLSFELASKIIGDKMSSIDDRLLNLIQLSKDDDNNEFIIASINQKSKELNKFEFKKAIKLKDSILISKYLLIPITFICVVYFTNQFNLLFNGLERITKYDVKFERPRPFDYTITNDELKVKKGESFILEVKTMGEISPSELYIKYNEHSYLMSSTKAGVFSHVFSGTITDIEFEFHTDKYGSDKYILEIQIPPIINNIKLVLDYPSYIKKKSEEVLNAQNIDVPRGTLISWFIETDATNVLYVKSNKNQKKLISDSDNFKFKELIDKNINYQIFTNNDIFKAYETLSYKINVIKDQHPSIKIFNKKDSLNFNVQYNYGVIGDDYGFSKLEVILYNQKTPKKLKTQKINLKETNNQDFYYTFPEGFNLKDGEVYVYFFRVVDNDPYKPKSIESEKFYYNRLSQEKIKSKVFTQQKKLLNDLDHSLDNYDTTFFDEFLKTNTDEFRKEKFNDFINQQIKQQKMFEKFTKDLDKQINTLEDNENEDLKRRLEAERKNIQKKKDMLEEISKIASKIKKDEVKKRLKEIQKSNKQSKRNLNQILELTKKMYVENRLKLTIQKLNQIAKKLEQQDVNAKNQKAVQKEFDDVLKGLDSLQNFAKKLRRTPRIERDKLLEEDAKNKMQEVQEQINKKEKSEKELKKENKKAAQYIKQLSNKLKKERKKGMMMELKMDIASTRQILDNLILYSFEQEDILKNKSTPLDESAFSKALIRQNELKQMFQHIDDSLYTLSLNQPRISEKINKPIEEVHYYTESALENISNNIMNKGYSDQQFALTNVNILSALVSDILNNLNMNMSDMNGKGKNKLPEQQMDDIIQKQKELTKSLEKQLKENSKKNNQKEELSEEQAKKQMESFKKQAELKKELQEQIEKSGLGSKAKKLSEDMENIKKQILKNNIDRQSINQMKLMYKKLLELKEAKYKQGKDNQRKSKTNNKSYKSPDEIMDFFDKAKKKESILLRESLPVENSYQQLINNYFNNAL